MSENMSAKKKKSNLIVGGVIASVVLLAVASNFVNFSPKDAAKELAIDAAKGAGKMALEKGKEKLAEYKANHPGGPDQVQGAIPVSIEGSSGNVLKNVESEQFISTDNVATKADFADTMLMNAIKAHDVERVKYLLDSGVNVAFTDNGVCFDKSEMDFPKDVIEMKNFIAVTSAKYKETVYTNKCSRMFLLAAANELNKQNNKDEFFVFNRGWRTGVSVYDDTPKDRMKREQEKIDLETKNEEIFKLILAKTPKKDYYVLPEIFLNTNVPFSIRKELLETYLNANPNEPVTANRASFLKMYDEAANQLMTENPNLKQAMATVSRFKNPWSFYTSQQVFNFFHKANDFDMAVERLEENKANEKSAGVVSLEVPKLTVEAMTAGEVKFNESTNSAFWYWGTEGNRKFVEKVDFQTIYVMNNELKLVNMIVSSKKVNMNYQDLQGNSVLHLIAAANNAGFNARPRPMAVATRYLLNSGINANLMNKEGMTPFMIAQKSQQGWGEISKAYSDKNYN